VLKLDISPPRKKDWVITQEAFDNFLGWLGEDREQAGRKYEEIRRKLIKIFTCRGCAVAEDLADETINRVVRKAPELKETYVGNPTHYFCGVAHNVHLEYLRKKREIELPPTRPTDEIEQEYECLEQCMQQLPPQNRELVLQYYQEEKQAKIENRRKLARRLGIELNALRIRAHRIRVSLQECMRQCLALKEGV
jgi:RNA polymerase sigma factor (sigma-70 family)